MPLPTSAPLLIEPLSLSDLRRQIRCTVDSSESPSGRMRPLTARHFFDRSTTCPLTPDASALRRTERRSLKPPLDMCPINCSGIESASVKLRVMRHLVDINTTTCCGDGICYWPVLAAEEAAASTLSLNSASASASTLRCSGLVAKASPHMPCIG
jgi:hypothetical protein